MIANFNFRTFAITLNIILNLCICHNINRLHFDCYMICIILLLTLLSNLLIYTFLKLSSHICKFCFYVLMNYSKTTNCFSLCVECISIPLPCSHLLIICISAKSAPQILSLKDEFILRFSNVLITSLCSFPANCSFPKTISTTVWVESLADLFAFPTS